ncbi:MAG TPA: HAMP domain-containing sensor histidine kinase [Gemmatimonadaceae bacterium]|nr:HAMP domain-containing sensor histidine kinase [Gemmatimonadaceae bacterium]
MPSRPSALRLGWPLLVLMISIGLTAFAAFDAQRAVRGQNAVVNRATREFSTFATWSYSEHLEQQLSAAAVELVGAVNHGENMHTNPRIPDADELVHYLPTDLQCDCHRTRAGPMPVAFFGFKIGSRDVDIARNVYPDPDRGWRSPMYHGQMMGMSGDMQNIPFRFDPQYRWLSDTLTVVARKSRRNDYGYGFVIAYSNAGPRPIIYTLMPTSWGDTMVYGAEYTRQQFQSLLGGVLDGKGLLPETFTKGAPNREVVTLRVSDPRGNAIYVSRPELASSKANELTLPQEYGSLGVSVSIRPERAGGLIIGGVPRSRLPFLLGLLLLAGFMSVVAVAQIRRETALAGMRADFVSSISHELRTPLAQIKLYLDTLRLGRAETAQQREWTLGHIDRETKRLSNLVENVLRFSRLGRSEGQPAEALDLAEEVGRVVEEFRPLAALRKSNIELVVTEKAFVLMRPEAIRHVVVNLLDNAVKYGPVSQTISVTVREQNREAIIEVIDEGTGVPIGDRETIWKAFARAKTATDAAGSGIGLTIVRDVVAQAGGKTAVDDAPNGGARFIVSLPSIPPPPAPPVEEKTLAEATAV